MVDPIRLGQLARVASLRRDRHEIAFSDAARTRDAREQAHAAAEAVASAAARSAHDADRQFAAAPASQQALLWRRVQMERAAVASEAAAASTTALDAAVAAQDRARAELLRADARLERTSMLQARAASAYARQRDERDADDRPATRLA